MATIKFDAVEIGIKDEGVNFQGQMIGPVYLTDAKGKSIPYRKLKLGTTEWYTYSQTKKLAEEMKLRFTTY